MDIESRKEPGAIVLALSGRMDALTAPEYEKKLKQLIDEGQTGFVVDLAGLSYISSAGLRGILTIAKMLKVKGGWIRFANVTGTVREVFDISGFASLFQIHDSVASALQRMP